MDTSTTTSPVVYEMPVALRELGEKRVDSPSVQVSVCGRLLAVPDTALASLQTLNRELVEQLKMSGPASLHLADVAGSPIRGDEDLSAALRDGRHPLQAALTVVALREIEQKKCEAETKKEEMTQIQWQIVVDQMAVLSTRLGQLDSQVLAMKDSSLEVAQHLQEEWTLQHEQLATALSHEGQEREASFRDLDMRFDRLQQTMVSERATREVIEHQLAKQVEAAVAQLEQERLGRGQEHAEMARHLASLRQDLDREARHATELRGEYLDMSKRTDLRWEDLSATRLLQQQRLSNLEGDAERLHGAVAGLEAFCASRMSAPPAKEDTQQHRDQMSRAVRDELLEREHHMMRLTKDFEASWQGMEARFQRHREEASEGQAALMERSRLLETRCAELESSVVQHAEAQVAGRREALDKTSNAMVLVDAVEMAQKASDVMLHATVSKVDNLVGRVQAAEVDLRQKARHDYWKPQMEAFQRSLDQQAAKIERLAKDVARRFVQESVNREAAQTNMRERMQACVDRIAGPSKQEAAQSSAGTRPARFVAVCEEPAAVCAARAAKVPQVHRGATSPPAHARPARVRSPVPVLQDGVFPRHMSSPGCPTPRAASASASPRIQPAAVLAGLMMPSVVVPTGLSAAAPVAVVGFTMKPQPVPMTTSRGPSPQPQPQLQPQAASRSTSRGGVPVTARDGLGAGGE